MVAGVPTSLCFTVAEEKKTRQTTTMTCHRETDDTFTSFQRTEVCHWCADVKHQPVSRYGYKR